jgi:hypothetical protein
VEAYLESVTLAVWERMIYDIETRYNRDNNMSHDGPSDGNATVFMRGVKFIGRCKLKDTNDKERDKLAWYVLNNYEEVQDYVK